MAVTRGLHIGMVAYGDVSHDSRVQREALSLAEAGHRVTVFATAGDASVFDPSGGAVTLVVLPPPDGAVVPGTPSPFRVRGAAATGRMARLLARGRWLVGYARTLRAWGRRVVGMGSAIDAWHVHDFAALAAVGPWVAPGPALIYDVHDLFVETGTALRLPAPLRRLVRAYEARLARRAALVVAVNRPLGEIVAEAWHPSALVVVHNCPPRWPGLGGRPSPLRQRLGLAASEPLVLYHGLLSANRGLEDLLAAIVEPSLAGVHLALLGYGEWRERLREEARSPAYGGRVHVLDAVPPADLLGWVEGADVGALVMPHDSLNLFVSTPNKLFECLMAGVPVVVSDFPAVQDIVREGASGPLGRSCPPADPKALALALASILALSPDDAASLRQRCRLAALGQWNWEQEVGRLVDAYAQLRQDGVSEPVS